MEDKKKKLNFKIIIPVIVAIVVIAGIVICINNKGTSKEIKENKLPETIYKIGDTVKTDIAEFALNDSQFTIALSNTTNDGTYFTPREYDSTRDVRNPFVAKTGSTLVYIDFTLSAIDRNDINTYVPFTVKYNKKDYSTSTKVGAQNMIRFARYTTALDKTGVWKQYDSSNILLFKGESAEYRGYGTIPVNVENLKDKYYITFELPTSSGKEKKFTYVVNE